MWKILFLNMVFLRENKMNELHKNIYKYFLKNECKLFIFNSMRFCKIKTIGPNNYSCCNNIYFSENIILDDISAFIFKYGKFNELKM